MTVNSKQDRQKRFDDAMAEVALLPAEQQVDALLQFLITVLNEMPTDAVRKRRDELMEHFSNCGCSFETCSALLEMVDHHIAIRERCAARHQAEARKEAKLGQRAPLQSIALTRPFPVRGEQQHGSTH